MNKNIISLENIAVSFDGEKILNDINLDIKDKEFVTFLGPSGCGKTTTLRIIGGFLKPDSGIVRFDGKEINNIPPYKRNVNTVFQRYALFPHLNVYDNIAFGLKIKKFSDKEIQKRVGAMLELVNLKGFEKRSIDRLSGGQQQRVALEITFIYVTHDQEEALTMSDTVVVMNNGDIQQIGSPVDIYNEPKNAFVADFIGESNILNGMMVKDLLVEINGHRFECVDTGFGENKPVDVVIRPEDIQLVKPDDSHISGVVQSVTFKGVHYEMLIEAYDHDWLVHSTKAAEVGSTVGIKFDPYDIHIMHKMND